MNKIVRAVLNRFVKHGAVCEEIGVKYTCEYAVYLRNSESSLCYTTDKSRAGVIVEAFQQIADLQKEVEESTKVVQVLAEEVVRWKNQNIREGSTIRWGTAEIIKAAQAEAKEK